MNRRDPIVKRRLAAIFCADVAGYVRLMHADERGTLRLLSAHREVTDRLIAHHGGRIANTAGDSILAEFASAVDALRCALEIQERLAGANEPLPAERRVCFRIGLHVGEAMVRDGDLFGDGVNIAARIQSLALPGTVCLSGTMHEFVHKMVPLMYEDLGPQLVKNLDAAVQVYLVQPSVHAVAEAVPTVHRRVEFTLARRFHRILDSVLRDITEPEGLTTEEPGVLASLRDAPGIDAQQLGHRVGIDPTKVRRMVARLQQRGLIERYKDPARTHAQSLRLTASGLELSVRVRPQILAAADGVMTPLSDHERETLQILLVRVITANEGNVTAARGPHRRAPPPDSDGPTPLRRRSRRAA